MNFRERGQAYVIKALIAIPVFGIAYYMYYTFLMGRGDTTGIIPALVDAGGSENTEFPNTHNNLIFILEMIPIFIIILVFVYVLYQEKNPSAGRWPS